jgi:hypothetical protein
MSLRRALAAALVAAIATVLLLCARRDEQPTVSAAGSSRESALAGASNEPARPGGVSSDPAHLAGAPSARAQQPAPPPALPDGPPFREQDFALTTDMAEGPMVALRSSARVGRALTVELGTTMPVPDGKQVFVNVSVSDALGNTILDCTWRDVELTADARKLECVLSADVVLPLAIAGFQLPAPSFVESPVAVAIDKGIHP